MTIAEGVFGRALAHRRARDRAIGEDAAWLREQIDDILGLTSTASAGVRYREALIALDEASREAAADNWDSYGARAVEPLALESATAFVGLLPLGLPAPEVAVTPDGEVLLEWQAGPRWIVTVSIGSSGVMSYAGLFGRSRAYGTEEFSDAIPPAVSASIARLFAKAD